MSFNLGSGALSLTFYSQPRDKAGNKYLGIKKSESYWKCYIANVDTPDYSKPYDAEIKLSTSTTDKPRRVNAKYIEAAAQQIFSFLMTGLITLNILMN